MANIPRYPRELFYGPLNGNQTALDWLALIRTILVRLDNLEAVVDEETGYLQVPGGDYFLTPSGDRLSLPGA
jgi:hypothetical protein